MKNFIYTLVFFCLISLSVTAQNTIFGYKSLLKNSGNYNTSIGYKTLFSNTFGMYNTALGTYSMYYNFVGCNNTSIGNSAMRLNNSGGYNVAIGRNSLYGNISGNRNNALGYNALCNSNGNNNNAFGYNALCSLMTGNENIAIGHKAGNNITTGTRNIIIGSDAYLKPISNYNIAIGYRVGSSDIGDNNIIIGKKISLPTNTVNAMNIGGVLYGYGFQSDLPNVASIVPNNGKIGINIIPTATSATLEVAGTFKITNQLPRIDLMSTKSFSNFTIGVGDFIGYDNSTPNDLIISGPIDGYGQNIVLKIPNIRHDGRTYIGFGDIANGVWVKIFNNRKMRVDGTFIASDIIVKTDVWADYVFNASYKLMPLREVEKYVHNKRVVLV